MFDDPILVKNDFDLNIIREYFVKLSKEIGDKAIKKVIRFLQTQRDPATLIN